MKREPQKIELNKYGAALAELPLLFRQGSVVEVIGLTIEAQGIEARVGELCHIQVEDALRPLPAEVVGFRQGRTLLMPLGLMEGIKPGSPVTPTAASFSVPVGRRLLGRVLNGLGEPIDGKGPLPAQPAYPITNSSPHPLRRLPIREVFATGVRAIDGLLTCGKGQRMGIFAGSGVGKSTLLGMLARNSVADVNVIALIGERGREVQEFIERDLGPEGLKRSVVVVSTSDQPPLVRIKGGWVATAIAEYFRDQGLDVGFLMDSVTRFAMAQREVGLAIGEPPATRGYTPSVFALLPRLMERTGTSERGTITGLYTVLVEGDDLTEPVTDTVRSVLDGHVVLSRTLASENHYPAIDILESVSRVMPSLTTPHHQERAGKLRESLAVYNRARDLIDIGAYAAGSNPRIDYAMAVLPRIHAFLRQPSEESSSYEETLVGLERLFAEAEGN